MKDETTNSYELTLTPNYRSSGRRKCKQPAQSADSK